MTRSLSCISALVLALFLSAGCSRKYSLSASQLFAPATSLQQISFCNGAATQQAWYRCLVNGKFLIKKIHLSGLLLLKYDSSTKATRAVFTNELGYTFFDFSIRCPDSFSVNRIMPQFDKPYMIRALRQDIQLLLGMAQAPFSSCSSGNNLIWSASSMNDKAYFYTNDKGSKILQTDVVAKNQLKARILTTPAMIPGQLPDSFVVAHLKTNFRIEAKKIVHEE